MANVTRRRTGEFLRTLFGFLLSEPAGMKAGQLIFKTGAASNLNEWEKSLYPSGGVRFEKILRFASIDCVKAGWIYKSQGIWSITPAGEKAYSQYQDPEKFYKEACKLYSIWKQEHDATSGSTPGAASDSEIEVAAEKLNFTFEEAEEQAWKEIEDFLGSTDPFAFQEIVADLLRAMGYHVSWVSPPGKDGGVDIIAYTDALGSIGPRIKVQVKRQQKTKVDSEGLKAFIATINANDVGIFVCLAGFTKDAADYARNQESKRMMLFDARQLLGLWITYYPKLADTARQRLPLKPIYFLAHDD